MPTPQSALGRHRPLVYLGASAQLAGLGLLSIVLIPLVAMSVALMVIWVGIPLLFGSLALVRAVSMAQRRLGGRLFGHAVEPPYREVHNHGLMEALQIRLTDPATYRDLLWLLISATLGVAVGISTLVFYLIVPLGLVVSPVIVWTFVAIGSFVLRRDDTDEMAQRIGELSTTRAEAVDAQAAELRRIERDLHDGAQARLVALGLNLGLAEQLMDDDPAGARELISESRRSASAALSDLRALVRGILPPVLADRGLNGGLQALALASPVKMDVDLILVGRAPAPVESAVYFAVAETLANAAKHSGGTSGWIWLRHSDGRLSISVGDNGVGGATMVSGGGLHGIGRRLAAFDGTVNVASPIGGPTIVSMELPCVLSSERI